jgi:hypothetical protein
MDEGIAASVSWLRFLIYSPLNMYVRSNTQKPRHTVSICLRNAFMGKKCRKFIFTLMVLFIEIRNTCQHYFHFAILIATNSIDSKDHSQIPWSDMSTVHSLFSLYRPWRVLGLREVEAPTFSGIQLTDGGKVVSPTRRQLFTPRKIPGTHLC